MIGVLVFCLTSWKTLACQDKSFWDDYFMFHTCTFICYISVMHLLLLCGLSIQVHVKVWKIKEPPQTLLTWHAIVFHYVKHKKCSPIIKWDKVVKPTKPMYNIQKSIFYPFTKKNMITWSLIKHKVQIYYFWCPYKKYNVTIILESS